uniref:Probable replication factor A 73 kDa subunit (inferred by orthology to a C. elegans protein) n=1 Tax=Strongyloides venezuelensis TaxID=75913 RepID=A0A0K0G1M8_STRVS
MPYNVQQEYELSTDFFKLLAENHGSRIILCLSDGTFFYEAALLPGDGTGKYKSYKMEKSRYLIKTLRFRSYTILKDSTKKIQLRIKGFKLLVEDSPIIGKPKRHSGILEDNLTLRNFKSRQIPVEESNTQSPQEEVNRVVRNVTNESSENDPSIVSNSSINPYLME